MYILDLSWQKKPLEIRIIYYLHIMNRIASINLMVILSSIKGQKNTHQHMPMSIFLPPFAGIRLLIRRCR